MDRLFKTLLHAGVGFVAVLVAHHILLGRPIDWWLTNQGASRIFLLAGFYALVAGLIEVILRVERSPWRFSSVRDAYLLVRSTLITVLTVLLVSFFLNRAEYLYRSVLPVAWVLQLGALSAGRLLRRAQYEGAFHSFAGLKVERRKGKRLLVVGSLEAADAALRYLERDPDHAYGPIGVVTIDERDRAKLIRNVPVAGTVAEWDSLLKGFSAAGRAPSAVMFLAPPNSLLSGDQLGNLSRLGVSLIRLPQLTESLDAARAASFAGVKSISIEELLARPARSLNLETVRSLVSGRRIFVTGAGGSIGSELCRQVAALGCAHLTLLDHSEFLLFEIDREISDRYPALSTQAVMCNIRDGERLKEWVAREKPDILFHAAALKHVPLIEVHPDQGFLTNVIGTRNVAEAAKAAKVSDMVLISTDKAVDPSNVMGATKRLAEEVVRGSGQSGNTRFTAVRFGNVLGSAGSVVPTFQDQILRGGPVTVTHPDVERYFMTIPEAVQLVLHAVASRSRAKGGQASTYVLDMGEPVRIKDLAERLISLSGKTPGKDIMIEFVGLRPGEKLTEALVDEDETVLGVSDGVMEIGYPAAHYPALSKDLRPIESHARHGDVEAVRRGVLSLIARMRTATA